VEWKNRKTHWYEAVSSALNFPSLKEVSQKSFVLLSNSKIEEISQNCFILDVVQFKKMERSRRSAVFLMLSTSKNEEVSQNSLVFKLADRQVDR